MLIVCNRAEEETSIPLRLLSIETGEVLRELRQPIGWCGAFSALEMRAVARGRAFSSLGGKGPATALLTIASHAAAWHRFLSAVTPHAMRSG